MRWQNILAAVLALVTCSLFFLDRDVHLWVATLSLAELEFFLAITGLLGIAKTDLLIPLFFCVLLGGFVNFLALRSTDRLILTSLWFYYMFFLLSLISSSLLVFLGKIFLGRSRPDLYEQAGILDFHFLSIVDLFGDTSLDILHLPFGFPSGHATIIGVKFACFALFFPRWRWLAAVVCFWAAFSRVVVGEHYLSDVVAGLCVGILVTLFYACQMAKRRVGFKFTHSGDIRVTPAFSLKRFFHSLKAAFIG